VGLIVFWEPQPLVASILPEIVPPTAPGQPLFILFKGQRTADDGRYQLTQIIYGDARQALN
jgi:hypothetical protein